MAQFIPQGVEAEEEALISVLELLAVVVYLAALEDSQVVEMVLVH